MTDEMTSESFDSYSGFGAGWVVVVVPTIQLSSVCWLSSRLNGLEVVVVEVVVDVVERGVVTAGGGGRVVVVGAGLVVLVVAGGGLVVVVMGGGLVVVVMGGGLVVVVMGGGLVVVVGEGPPSSSSSSWLAQAGVATTTIRTSHNAMKVLNHLMPLIGSFVMSVLRCPLLYSVDRALVRTR